jgi:hypothetical protein
MKTEGYTTLFTVDQTPEEVFHAMNNVRGWWSVGIGGSIDTLGAEFNFHYKDTGKNRIACFGQPH